MATTLTFTPENGQYTSTVTVNSEFNLHIEGTGKMIYVLQKTPTSASNFVMIDSSLSHNNDYDTDFAGVVYPKTIKIVCNSNPTVGILTEA